ncbi:MAG TPA: DRTGG domain-containing protein [Spirochaetia bacterium]|nr:DRTGG domain-containing protein [Spirochaetia bacterium]
MTIRELVRILDGEVVSAEDKLDQVVDDFAATDLLSDVLAVGKENFALLTGLTNAQILRTAQVTNARCVVIVRNKQPQPEAVDVARRSGIPLILSPFNMYEACARLGSFVEKHDGRVPQAPDPSDP